MDLCQSHHLRFLFLAFTLISQPHFSWSWFFSSNEESHSDNTIHENVVSEFSMEALYDKNGVQLVENAKNKMLAANSCWQSAYQNVFKGCSKTLADEESRSRLAWHLSDCFQRHTGRPPFPHCSPKDKMRKCLQKLDTDGHKIYLEYFLETNSICHQLQTEAFKHQTERLVNELKTSAEYAEIKFEKIEQHGELLLQNSKQVHNSLASIDARTQQVAQTSKVLEDHVNSVLRYSEVVYEQSKSIASSQTELSEGQARMKENLVEGMALLRESYENLGEEIVGFRNEAAEIEKEIVQVGDAMSSKMSVLQSKANDIGDMAGTSLDKQKELLNGQSQALEGLNFLTKFQSQALEESRVTLQKLAEFGHAQQEELLRKQKQLHQSHDNLVENSKLILAAQEAFESKQASMFVAIDKLFALHSAMLFESRVIIAFLVYSVAIFIVYMLTSIKQAYNVRHRLYLGLCVTFLIEVSVFWCDSERQGRPIHVIRAVFAVSASIQYVYAIFMYRDYEVLNHEMLVMLMEKVNAMQRGKEVVAWEAEEEEGDDVDWRSWVVEELPEEEEVVEDPDYLLPHEVEHDSCNKRYNLRRRG